MDNTGAIMDTKSETKVVNRLGFYGILREDYKSKIAFGLINGQWTDIYHTFQKGTRVNMNQTQIRMRAKYEDHTIRVAYYNGYDTSSGDVPLRMFDVYRLDIVETTTVQETVTKL
jgi:hypothetical protein